MTRLVPRIQVGSGSESDLFAKHCVRTRLLPQQRKHLREAIIVRVGKGLFSMRVNKQHRLNFPALASFHAFLLQIHHPMPFSEYFGLLAFHLLPHHSSKRPRISHPLLSKFFAVSRNLARHSPSLPIFPPHHARSSHIPKPRNRLMQRSRMQGGPATQSVLALVLSARKV